MPSAEIISIGTELLLGEIVDTNAVYLAKAFRDIGVDLYRKVTVGDNIRRIAGAIQEALARSDIILTTGGLGPTVDDPTREAVAQALGRSVEFRPELWEQIQERYRRYGRVPTENNKRQAYVPQGAINVANPVGTAPAFIVETGGHSIISLPGVPREMEYLMQNAVIPYLRQHFSLHSLIKTRLVHTAGVGESQIDELIGDLETYSNPTVGLAAHSGQVDVRITAKADSETEAIEKIQQVEEIVRERLGDSIYGVDDDTLDGVVMRNLQEKGWTLAAVEAGLGGELLRRLALFPGSFKGGEMLSSIPSPTERLRATADCRLKRTVEVGLGIFLIPGEQKQEIFIDLVTPQGEQEIARPYGGPPGNAPRWAVNHSLAVLKNLALGGK